MRSGTIAKKLGMTRVFTEDARQAPQDDAPDYGSALDVFVFTPNTSETWGVGAPGGGLMEPGEDQTRPAADAVAIQALKLEVEGFETDASAGGFGLDHRIEPEEEEVQTRPVDAAAVPDPDTVMGDGGLDPFGGVDWMGG